MLLMIGNGTNNMSCMEHRCNTCGGQFMDNSTLKVCPVCKSTWISNLFDEEDERDEVVSLFEE